MKLKRIMAIVLCFAMVLSTMSFNVFAIESTVGTEAELKVALAAGGTIVLSNDITVAEQLVIPEGVEVTIDLNGKTITGELNGDSTTNHIYVMANYGTLTITDSGEDGAIISRGVYNYGKLTLENGKIDACDCNGGYAVNNESGSVFIMNGGSVTADYEDGDDPESGNYDATALDVPENCTATLNGGTISNAGNFTFAISVEGELIVPEDSTVSVTGVHGTVAVMGGEANIAGGTFKLVGSPNVTDSLIYVPSGTANITGGSFDASETLSSSGRIIGAYDSGKVTVNGGTFTSNGWFDFADSSIENVTVNDAICVDCDDTVKSYVAENATITLNGESYTAPDDGGSDGEEDTVLINTVEDLIELRDNVNAGTNYYEGKYVKLNADIDLGNINWTPIGSASVDHGFMGNFDGNGHTIFNLTIEDPSLDRDGYAYAGFFGVTEGTENNQNTIKNLTIENVTITTDGHIASAAIAYPYYTIVENVNICGDIAIEGGNYTAGVLAYTRRCVNAKNLTITGNDGSYIKGAQVVGGVISDIQMNGGLIADYSNFNAEGLTVKGELNVGGISGIIASQTLDTCSVKDVTLDCDDARVGTVAGCLGGVSTISNATVENVSGASALIGGTYNDGKSVEAKIGDTYYATLAKAFETAENGDTVTLLCDIENVIEIPDGVTLNTNGYKCIQAKGTWGGIDWTLDAEGTLTVAPTVNEITLVKPYSDTTELYEVGEWPAAVNDTVTAITGWPYKNYDSQIKKLVIEEGVTSIGSFAMNAAGDDRLQLTNFTGEVVIPSTVSYIGQEAFQNCKITKLTFAEGGTEKLCIAPGAFKKAVIDELVLPADRPEIHIHCWAFNDCTSLKDVTLPANITTFSQWTHVDYTGMDYVNGWDSQVFARCWALESISFGSEEVKTLFFNAPKNKNNIDAIGDVEIKVVVPAVAKIGDKGFDTLAKAIEAAQANDTITLVDNVTEDVTINQNITLDGNGKTYTGTMTLSSAITATIENVNFVNGWITKDTKSAKGNYTIKNCTFDGEGARDYSLRFKGAASITVENCDVKDYKYSFLYVSAGTNIVSVKDVTVDGCANYGIYFASGVNDATIEGLTVKNSNNGFIINNTANRALTIKDCKMENVGTAINHTNGTKTITCTVLGANDFGTSASSEYAKYVLGENATLKAPEGYTVTASNDAYFVKYVDGIYKSVKAVAQVGEVKYESLAEAIAVGGDVILLADVENAGKIVVNKDVSLDLNGKTISGVCDEGQKYVFMVNNGVAMNIKDSSAEKTGKITYAGNNSTGWIIDVEGNLVLESGTLELTGTWDIGYAVDVRPNAWGTPYTEETSFVMDGGKITSSDGAVRVASSSADTYKDVSASFTMNGGEIEAAWDGIFVQQSNAAWDVLNVTINDGTIKSDLNPIRFYGPAATTYVNGEDCVAIALNGGTLTYTGTEAREWMVEGILRLGGGVTADDFMKDCDVTASETFAQANVADGYYWVSIGRKYRLQTLGEYSFVVEADKTEIVDSGSFVVEVKVSSEKVDNFHSSEYIVTYNSDLLTCAEDNGVNDYDSTTGTLRLQCLDGANVNEVIGTLNFTTKEFYLTQETEIKVSGIVCATQYDTAVGTSEPVSDGAVVILLKDSFNVTVGSGLEGDAVAYNKTDYVVRVAAENQDKQNTIKYTIKDANGNPVENSVILPAGTNEYTISGDDIIGDMTFEITDTYSIEIITDYVTGYALILVDGSADGYTYNGHQMLKINRASGTFEYNGRYGWLVDGSAPGTTLESVEAAAYAAIRAGEESKAVETGYDVNSYINGDGKINFYDVSAAYACQKIDFNLSDVDDYFYMELYLASDANCDGKVDSSDSAVISVNYN